MKVYLVGGAVRDQLLGLPIKERDWVVVGASPEALVNLGYRQVGRGFPVFLHPKTQEEYALARTEKKLGPGYYGFTCDANKSVTLVEDLARRDLTINAIAMDADGVLIDPYHGQADIRDKVLRHVSPAFVEDPVRVLRIARFMARFQHLGFTVAPETRVLMQKMVRSGELDHLVVERVWQEWHKSFHEKNPDVFITTLRDCGALRIILPEIDRLFGIPNPPQHHPEVDTGIHSLMALHVATQLSQDPVVRFAALVHDVGKACTPMGIWPKQKNHESLGLPVIDQLCHRLAIPNRFQKLAGLAVKWHLAIHSLSQQPAADILGIFHATQAFQDNRLFENLLLVCESDSRGRGVQKDAVSSSYRQARDWRVLLAECKKITARTFVEQGYTGEAIKDAVYVARMKCVEAYQSQQCPSYISENK